MQTELGILNKKRAIIKSKLTRFKTYIEKYEVGSHDLAELENRFEKALTLLDEFDNIQTQIDLASEDEEINTTEREEFENSYHRCVALAKRSLKLTPIGIPDHTNAIPTNLAQPRTRLPEITLPSFDGKYNEWLNFHDTFQSLVNSNVTLSTIDKFQYLKTSLRGEAARVIQAIPISEQNYSVAWNKIVQRFEDREGIVLKHVKDLFELPPVNKESHFLLRQISDDISNHLDAIKALDKSGNLQDRLLVFLISGKLDSMTKREWEKHISNKTTPTVEYLLNFINERAKLLEKVTVEKPYQHKSISPTYKNKFQKAGSVNYMSTYSQTCIMCKGTHPIYACQLFIDLPVSSRLDKVKALHLCKNCLRHGHTELNCKSVSKCKICRQNHHTLLHFNSQPETQQKQSTNLSIASTSTAAFCAHAPQTSTLLATARITILDSSGNSHQCRAILDSGSQSNFITENLCNTLKLPRINTLIPVSGISQTTTTIKHLSEIKLKSNFQEFETHLSCLVVPKLTECLPREPVQISRNQIPKHIHLADPNFNVPGSIELLIGAGVFWELLSVGQIQLSGTNLRIQKTKLGWVVVGNYTMPIMKSSCNLNINEKIYQCISKFWELDTCDNLKGNFSREEQMCDEYFLRTTERDSEGRFVVSIPFNAKVEELGETYNSSLRRFYTLEKKLNKNPVLRSAYVEFMNEYERLGHMTVVTDDNRKGYYLPHHAVLKEDSTTTKVRVVFDGSHKSTTGLSLNDVQFTGPALQNDIFDVLLRFRQYRFVIKADIAKMYRQVLIDPNQRDYQKIFWRSNESESIKIFKLNTVTYGTASAPFLAIRSLLHLADMHKDIVPEISQIITRDFYVDDLLTGADSLNQLSHYKSQISTVLQSAGFELRKWVSNNAKLLTEINDNNGSSVSLVSDAVESKTLGVIWNRISDQLEYHINNHENKKITKRIILSEIAQIFDPLGLIGPTVIKAKLIMQKLWQIKLSWDAEIPDQISTAWHEFKREIGNLNQINIPRHVVVDQTDNIELHGFCDASEVAYGAVLYLKSVNKHGHTHIRLLCAKSRVAPLKVVTLPRLELCGALLLARLSKRIKNVLTLKINRECYWTDSTIVLSWIYGSPVRWKQFVAHRIAEIQDTTNASHWRHVPTHENPADIISRGLYPTQLKTCDLWWYGPQYLQMPESMWPSKIINSVDESPEQKPICNYHTLCNAQSDFNIFARFSCFKKLRRVTAYILRFLKNCKIARAEKHTRTFGVLSPSELDDAEIKLTRVVQQSEFGHEIHALTSNKEVSKGSKLLSLTPFLDKNGVLRVGGRISKSEYPFEQKHPVVLPGNHAFTKLIVMYEHNRALHSGVLGTLASIRCRYWPLSGRNSVRQVIRKCMKCFKAKPKSLSPLMGELPVDRLNANKPFMKTGVDYAGPFLLKEGPRKRKRTVKAYIAIFVCMTVKAVHIELVSDLTTAAFLASLRRFMARRGMVSDIYSDNGRNFVGANNELRNMAEVFQRDIDGQKIIDTLSNDYIKWHFMPPNAPNFGGLWEASVKSIKNHLMRVIGDAKLNFEEFATVLTQIEAVLNSRPLTSLSNDPHDLSFLTPGHFLIGESLTAPPDPNVCHLPDNRLSRWQHVQKLQQHFWLRWSKEYISLLQQRAKWKVKNGNELKIGALVIIKDDNLPPLRWLLGRISALHSGTDGITRVVSVKTRTQTLRRPVSRICVLPSESDS